MFSWGFSLTNFSRIALLSDKGFVASFKDDTGEDREEAYKQREFEKRFFSEATNQLFCKTFLENAIHDPISNEIGKSILFAVSQNHAAKLVQILNDMADRMRANMTGVRTGEYKAITNKDPIPTDKPACASS